MFRENPDAYYDPVWGYVSLAAIQQHNRRERRHNHWMQGGFTHRWLSAPPIAEWNSNTVRALARHLDAMLPPHPETRLVRAEIIPDRYSQYGSYALAVSVSGFGVYGSFGDNRKPHLTVAECLRAWLDEKGARGLLTLALEPLDATPPVPLGISTTMAQPVTPGVFANGGVQ